MDGIRTTFEQQQFVARTKAAPAGMQSAAEKVDAARDRLTLAISVYVATLEDFQAQIDACTRR